MTANDTEAVAQLVKSTFEKRLWPYLSLAQSGSAAFMAVPVTYSSAFPNVRSFVVREGGMVAAFASFKLDSQNEAFLSYICVHLDFRGKGIATALIDHFLESEKEVHLLSLDVFSENVAALNLYSKLGFERGSRSVWVERAMPQPTQSGPINGLASALAAHKEYGFCEISTFASSANKTFGVLGDTVVRCPDPASFDDDSVLAAIRSIFDSCVAFAIVKESELENVLSVYSTILWSERMVLEMRKKEEVV